MYVIYTTCSLLNNTLIGTFYTASVYVTLKINHGGPLIAANHAGAHATLLSKSHRNCCSSQVHRESTFLRTVASWYVSTIWPDEMLYIGLPKLGSMPNASLSCSGRFSILITMRIAPKMDWKKCIQDKWSHKSKATDSSMRIQGL